MGPCNSLCQRCIDIKDVCENCQALGQVSHHQPLRACTYCLEHEIICVKRAFFAVAGDCETGNKAAFGRIKNDIEAETINDNLALVAVMPDCPHVGKSLKASFTNWWLKLDSERGNIGLLRTLRKRSDVNTKEQVRRLIKRNDHVKNKDRQDPSAVIALCNDKLTGYLRNVGYVCHTIIPELDKFTSDNRLGMYPLPVSVAVPKYGWILFLSFDSKSHCTTLYHARLHSPVDKIVAIKKNLKSENVQCCGNVAFLSSSKGPIVTHELEANYLQLKPDKLTTKQRIAEVHQRFNLPPCDGTIKSQQEKLKSHLESKRKSYIDRGSKPDEISFEDTELTNDIEATHIHSRDLLFVAATKERKIASVELCYDGVGTKAKNTTVIVDYNDNWGGVSSLTVSGSALFVAHHDGVLKVSLETNMPVVIYEGNCKGCCLAPFENGGALFADQHRSSIYTIRDNNEISAFAGTGVRGSQDGPAGTCQFQQPIAICTELDSVAYVCDAQTSSIKIITQVKETAKFLQGAGKLYEAFSVHNKGERYQKHTLQESADLLSGCKATLSEFEKSVRSKEDIGKRTLNGPEGCVAAVTVKLVDLLHWGVRQLSRNVDKFCYKNADLLSCLTLDVEHLHATSHRKHPFMSKQEYCRSLGNTVKESVKQLSTSLFFISLV